MISAAALPAGVGHPAQATCRSQSAPTLMAPSTTACARGALLIMSPAQPWPSSSCWRRRPQRLAAAAAAAAVETCRDSNRVPVQLEDLLGPRSFGVLGVWNQALHPASVAAKQGPAVSTAVVLGAERLWGHMTRSERACIRRGRGWAAPGLPEVPVARRHTDLRYNTNEIVTI
jgi:hypothetical protein